MKNLKKFEGIFEDMPESWEPTLKSVSKLAEYVAERLDIDFDLDVEDLPYNKAFVIKIGRRVVNSILSGCSVMVDDHNMKVSISHMNDTNIWEIDLNETSSQFSSWDQVYDKLHPVVAHWFRVDREVQRLQLETEQKFNELPVVDAPDIRQYLK